MNPPLPVGGGGVRRGRRPKLYAGRVREGLAYGACRGAPPRGSGGWSGGYPHGVWTGPLVSFEGKCL